MNRQPSSLWLALSLPPILFLLVIIVASIYIGFIAKGDPQAIAEQVPAAMPTILLIVQLLLGLFLFWLKGKETLDWSQLGWNTPTNYDIGIGLGAGLVIALAYLLLLAPFLTYLQSTVGDYVPPGEILATLANGKLIFFIANVLLAPFVEETIYRGYALPKLYQRYSPRIAIMLSCLFFGLLHWSGGFWYIILTGSVAGGLFAGLYHWRDNIIAPYVAHLTLNVIEFLFIWTM